MSEQITKQLADQDYLDEDNTPASSDRTRSPHLNVVTDTPQAETPHQSADKAKPADHSRLSGLAINEEGFAFDPRSGESFTVNATGREIIHGLTNGQSLDEIARSVSERYVMNIREVRGDIRDFTEQLRALHLLGDES